MTILGGHNCVPGERLGSIDEFEGGRGTYIRKGFIYSSRIGKIRFVNNPIILENTYLDHNSYRNYEFSTLIGQC